MKAYASYCKDKAIIEESSSGGIFTLIANCILDKNGVIYGAAFNDKLEVVHTRIDTKENLYKLKGSKYVQSLLRESYKNTLNDLNEGKYVLFTGTPCQIAGLKNFLKKDYKKLYTQDIVCHGVPIIKAWNAYKSYLNKEFNSKLKQISFRNKSKGWENYLVKLELENGKTIKEPFQDNIYMKAFLKNIDLRNSCYNCKYKTKERTSDITLADFWGIKNVCTEMYNSNGTSLMIIQSKKGQELFNSIKDSVIYKNVDLEEAIKFNSAMTKSVEYNKNKKMFFEEIKKNDFEYAVRKYIHKESKKIKIKRILKKIIIFVRRKNDKK